MVLLGRVIVPIAFIAFALLFIINIIDLEFRATAFPFFAIAFILVLATIVIVREIYLYLRQRPAVTPDPDRWRGWAETFTRPIGGIVLLTLYVYAMPRAGFFLSTLAFLMAMCVVIGISWRKLPLTTGIMVVVTVAAYLFFSMVLQIPLP